jgi:hypothetical protein
MPRHLAYALTLLLLTVIPAGAVDLTGEWVICADCRIDGVCDPFSSPAGVDQWSITQTGTSLSVDSSTFPATFTGTIDSTSGAFDLPKPPNLVAFSGVGTDVALDGMYDSGLQSGHIVGARRCDPMAPACDDGDSCTDDTCVTATIGTCTDDPAQDYCTHVQNGSCVTTTSTSTTSTTTTSLLPFGHYPVTGQKLLLKQSSSGRQTLVFVTKDPTAFVPALGSADDPSLVTTQIGLISPTDETGNFDIAIPPGVGKPGWQVKPIPGPQYKFTNSFAPVGISVVRSMKMRAGKGMKIVARVTGLPMTTPLGAVGITIRFDDYGGGYPIVCAHFGAASIRKDSPPVFIAKPSPAPQNCYAATLRAP